MLTRNHFAERTILWYILFWGCNINYMFRMNINIAIVSMVKHSKNSTNVNVTHECPASIVSLKLNESSVQRISTDLDVSKTVYSLNIVFNMLTKLHHRYILLHAVMLRSTLEE